MILSFDLGNEIVCEKLCQDISQAINRFVRSGNDISNCQLVIDIRKVIDSAESLLPKLEHNKEL